MEFVNNIVSVAHFTSSIFQFNVLYLPRSIGKLWFDKRTLATFCRSLILFESKYLSYETLCFFFKYVRSLQLFVPSSRF